MFRCCYGFSQNPFLRLRTSLLTLRLALLLLNPYSAAERVLKTSAHAFYCSHLDTLMSNTQTLYSFLQVIFICIETLGLEEAGYANSIANIAKQPRFLCIA